MNRTLRRVAYAMLAAGVALVVAAATVDLWLTGKTGSAFPLAAGSASLAFTAFVGSIQPAGERTAFPQGDD